MLSLVLDEHREDASCLSCHFNPMERQKLLRAKDLLLADLTQAPGVAELARESGLSVLKIKRGFRVLFNNSVYGLFQAERMQEARRRLANGNTSRRRWRPIWAMPTPAISLPPSRNSLA